MNKHSKTALIIFGSIIAVVLVLFGGLVISLNNNSAAKYREDFNSAMSSVSGDFEENRDMVYDLAGINTIVETAKETRNELVDKYYQALDLMGKYEFDQKVNDFIDNAVNSVSSINEKLTTAIEKLQSGVESQIEELKQKVEDKGNEINQKLEDALSALGN